MATIASILTKIKARLASLNTKTGRSDTDLNTAINALPSKKTADNVTVSGKTVTTPAGIYFSEVQKSVSEGELPTPQISVSSSGVVTATVDMVQSGAVGYIPYDSQKSKTHNLSTQGAATITPTTSEQTAVASGKYTTGAVKVAAIPSSYIIPSGTKTISSSGTHDVKAYASATVGSGSATTPATTITANPSLSTTYTSGSGYKMSVSKTQSVTPTVSAGYVSSGTAGTITVSGSAYVAQSSTGSATSSTSDTATATIGYGQQTTIGAGYYPSARIIRNSVSAGKATTPTTSITATNTISIDSSGKITATASGSKSITPTVTAGYVSSGTAGTVSVSGSGTLQLTTQAAKTVTPTTSNLTAVASGRYTTGAVTVKGDANLVAGNIKKGVSIFGVSGSFEGGASVRTTSVIIDTVFTEMSGNYVDVFYTQYVNGQFVNQYQQVGVSQYVTLTNVAIGVPIILYCMGMYTYDPDGNMLGYWMGSNMEEIMCYAVREGQLFSFAE